MPAPQHDRRYRVNEAVVSTVLEDEAVLLHLETQHYFTVNETGLAIWSLLSEMRSVSEIGASLSQRYEIDPGQAVNVAERFIGQLLEDGLISRLTPDSADADETE